MSTDEEARNYKPSNQILKHLIIDDTNTQKLGVFAGRFLV